VRVVIVDDEPLACQAMRRLLANHPEVEIAGEALSLAEAETVIRQTEPDLVFLDIELGSGGDGFALLTALKRPPLVVFVTAYAEHAVEAFAVAAVDYLLKPFSADRLKLSLDRVRRRVGEKPPMPAAAELKASARPPDQYAQRIAVKDGARVHVIPVEKLDYAEAQDDYVSLRSEKKDYLKQQTISSLEASLDPARFVRVHRSYLVNLERIAKIEPYTKDARLALLADGSQIPVSRAGYARLKELLEG